MPGLGGAQKPDPHSLSLLSRTTSPSGPQGPCARVPCSLISAGVCGGAPAKALGTAGR